VSTSQQTDVLTKEGMERTIRVYFDGCNEADIDKMVSCFVPEAVHYFPPGVYGGAWRGAQTIAERWVSAVDQLGSMWTIDQILVEPSSARAVIEWTHFKTFKNTMLRGDEWYVFDRPTGLIREIRAYYASPQDPNLERLELDGFDYAGRGYVLEPPFSREPNGGS
jgi:hypothetical protein